MNAIETLTQIALDIQFEGGVAYLVGGAARDGVMRQTVKDIDVEVFNLPSNLLELILSRYGKVDTVGKSFGIIKLFAADTDFDFSLPRRESKSGVGHKGFIVQPDWKMTTEEASARRDFTINSLMVNVLTGEYIDHYGGREDIENRTLRATSEHFNEDPLRVLRAMQFAGRFDMRLSPKTIGMCFWLRNEYPTLSVERVWGEWQKWAAKSIKPSMGLWALYETEWLALYPEIHALCDCPQHPEYHPEGDAWAHTCHVVDAAANIAIRDGLSPEDRTILVLAALCHDLGKPETTAWIDGKGWTSHGHDQAGAEPTISFLTSIGCPQDIITQVVALVVDHMAQVHCLGTPSRRFLLHLLKRLGDGHTNLDMLMRVIESDHSGRPPKPQGQSPKALAMYAAAQGLNVQADSVKPILMGRHLLERGAKPGKQVGEALRRAFEAQLNDEFSDLEGALDWHYSQFEA